jgi:hypothetical protein
VRASLTVEAATLAAANDLAVQRFRAFFGNTEFEMTVLEAQPGVQVRSGVADVIYITWTVDYEALA